LVGLGADFAAFVVGELVAHFLDEDEQGSSGPLTVTTALGDAPGTLDNRLRLLPPPEAAKNKPLRRERLGEQGIFPAAAQSIYS
jgi:hypothetical protein